jgi:sialate O-acetylesterase
MAALVLVSLLACTAENGFGADLSVAAIFSDGMVLQRAKPVPIWGWADAKATVAVEFDGQRKTTIAGTDGSWQVKLDAIPALHTGQRMVVVCGKKSKTIRDVVVGEVWFAGGQSNMAFGMQDMANHLQAGRAMVAEAAFPLIRMRRIRGEDRPSPQKDLAAGSSWEACTPVTVLHHSAVAYVFAHRLHLELDVPVGILDCSWGGKPIEPFIPIEEMTGHPTLSRLAALAITEDAAAARDLPGGTFARSSSWFAGRIFNARIAPVAPYAIRGAIWYQGESNCGAGEDPRDYAHKMRAMIRGWRRVWNNPNLPFYFIQLPQWRSYAWPYLREEQLRVLDTPNTGMVITLDLDHEDNIHPPNKIDVGERLARWPLARQYGKDLTVSGPMYAGAAFAEGEATVRFDHAEGGLVIGRLDGVAAVREAVGATLNGFELLGDDNVWRDAAARIVGQTVVVTNPDVPKPFAVRYACRPQAKEEKPWNLYNRAWLPASPFCSDWQHMPYDPARNPVPDQR